MDLDWHLMRISEEDATSSQPPPPPNPIADARPRKKKAQTLRETDWEPYKDRIIQLHLTEKRPLPEVRILIEQEFGFNAGIRQYRSRLSKWKLDKNVKPDEMKAIVRHRQQPDLIETSKPALKFRVRGQEVEPHKIERWMKRHDIGESMMHAPSPVASTPSAVSYATMSEIGSPGIIHDVDLAVEHTTTTPRQSISSSLTTPRQRTDNAFEVPPWDTTNPLHGLHVVQVDDQHFFARWKYKFDATKFHLDMESAMVPIVAPWLRNVPSERTYRLVPEREAIVWCRYIMHVCLCGDSLSPTKYPSDPLNDIDLIIYICHSLHTQTVSLRFIVEGTQAKNLHNRAMGFDLVTNGGVQILKTTHWEPWMYGFHYGLRRLLVWNLVIADKSGLRPFTWPSNDADVERAHFFKSRFGHDAATNSLL